MNTLQPDNATYLALATVAGGLACILILVSLVFIVRSEEQQRANNLVPKPLSPQEILISPTPLATYKPNIPGVSKQEAFNLFQTVTFNKDLYRTDKHLVRWEQETIPWQLRGQFTSEDTQCMQSVTQQFNSAMETAKLEEQSTSLRRNGIELYILPSNQFSSVNPDIRPEQPAQLFYSLSGYTFSSVELLIDTNQSIDSRCYYMRNLMLRAVGLESPVHANYLVGESTSPSFLQYGRLENLSHSEMLRLLYSPLLTAGLTEEETKRRILQ